MTLRPAFAKVFDTFPMDLWVMDRNGRYTAQNRASRRNWGDLVGTTVDDLDAPPDLKALWKENDRRALAGETVQGSFEVQEPNRNRRYVDLLTPLYEEGTVIGVLGANVEVTDLLDR